MQPSPLKNQSGVGLLKFLEGCTNNLPDKQKRKVENCMWRI